MRRSAVASFVGLTLWVGAAAWLLVGPEYVPSEGCAPASVGARPAIIIGLIGVVASLTGLTRLTRSRVWIAPLYGVITVCLFGAAVFLGTVLDGWCF